MRTIIVNNKHKNKKLDRIIRDSFPSLPPNALFKAFRKKDIKVNGVRVKENYIVSLNDKIDIYIVDDILLGSQSLMNSHNNKTFSIIYEDTNVLIVNKSQGVPVHPDATQINNTLIDLVRMYLTEKGEASTSYQNQISPFLCHRLDRNTGGLVIIAKNGTTLDTILDKMQKNEFKKYYLCLVSGKMESISGELKGFLFKDAKKSRVFINDSPTKGSLKIITRYKVISYENNISTLEIELITGRTHQIRAHLAHIGHPIIGDGKYGSNSINRSFGVKQQQLWAYKLVFNFKGNSHLDYLNNKIFKVKPEFQINVNKG